MSWELKKQIQDKLNKEKGYYLKNVGLFARLALIYPNSYFVGMSNLGLHIIYDLINKRNDYFCERFFLPEKKSLAKYNNTHTPLLSMETQSPLSDFSILAFCSSFEMDYFNVLKILECGKITLNAADRGEREPLIIAGGPCATFNPEPLSAIIDAFVIGEGEVILPKLLDTYQESQKQGLAKADILKCLAMVPGVYVPSFYEHRYDKDGSLLEIIPKRDAPKKVKRQWVRNLDDYEAHTVIVTEETEFNFYLLEIARGCGRHCRFCMAGYSFRKPRSRSLEFLQKEVQKAKIYQKRLGLMGAAISDYPEIDSLSEFILNEGLDFSVASLRADSITEKLVQALKKSGLKTLTLAPEAGSKRLRMLINKGIEEEHIVNGVKLGIQAGIKQFKLYFMVGLPTETEEDIDAIIDLSLHINAMLSAYPQAHLTLSINPFVPKPFTPFQWLAMADKKVVEQRLKRITKALRPQNITINLESIKEAYIQAVLARGDRRVGEALILSGEGGSKAFMKNLKKLDLSADDYLYRRRQKEELYPWDVLDIGVTRQYLYSELEKAIALKKTACCIEGCHRCGVC